MKSREELQSQADAEHDGLANLLTAVAHVKADAATKGYGRNHGGVNSCKCPLCTDGTIRYSVAAVNGHAHARCSTAGCLSFME